MPYMKEIKAIIREQMDKYFAANKVRINEVTQSQFESYWGLQTVYNYVAKVSYTDIKGERIAKKVFIEYAPMIKTLIDFDWEA